VGCSTFLGPAVVGFGLPGLVVVLTRERDHLGIMATAMALLVIGGYVGLFALIGGAFGSSRGDDVARVPLDVGAAEEGALAGFAGRVVATSEQALLRSPLGQRTCVWASVALSVNAPGPRGKRLLRYVARDHLVPFRIDDGAGTIVAVDAADGILRDARDVTMHHAKPAGKEGEALRAYAKENGVNISGADELEARESVLAAGDRVFVLGVRRAAAAYRGAGEIVLGSGPEDALLATTETREELIRALQVRGSKPAFFFGLAATLAGIALTIRAALP
jgi:hypothetical protein